MAVGRIKFANQEPLVTLLHNPYQAAFMADRRRRVCKNHRHQWTYVYNGQREDLSCPTCGGVSVRAFTRYLLRAGRRGGKTRICALAMIEELTIPFAHWWATAPTYRMLEDYVLPAFFSQIPQAWIDHKDTEWSESELTLRLPQRSIAQFRSLENPDSGRGPGLSGLWMDEIALLTRLHWETISPTLTDKRGILIAGTTPRGPDWVHERFYQLAEQGMPGYWATHYSSLHNPFLDPSVIEEARRTMTPLMFQQEYMADIVTFTGAIYGEILGECVIDGTDEEMKAYFPEWPNIDSTRPSVTGLDPGTDHPFAGVHLVASPRGLVAVGEYEQRKKPFAIHAAGIQQMRRGFDSRIAIDRSQAQAQIELMQYGLYTQTAENDVVAGINRVSAWMLHSAGKFPGPTRNGIETHLPRGLVLPKSLVPTLIKRLQSYRWDESEKADGATKPRELVYKKDDDLCDALRYALMVYPELPQSDPVVSTQRRDLAGMPDDMRLQIERNRRVEEAIQRRAAEQRAEMGEDVEIPVYDEDLMAEHGPLGQFQQFYY